MMRSPRESSLLKVPVASDVVETATHCRSGVALRENCASTQRLAILSYMTMGSPSLLVWQPPPKPDQREWPATGPLRTLPVALSKTAKELLTHCTYWVRPTAPLVSGGALVILKPAKPEPSPSKPSPAVGARPVGANGAVCWCTASGTVEGFKPSGNGIARTRSFSRSCPRCALELACTSGMSRTAIEVS